MLQWIKCIGSCLCVVAFVMNVGLADTTDEKVRLANELDIETGEAMIKVVKRGLNFMKHLLKIKKKDFSENGTYTQTQGKKNGTTK